MNIKTDVKLHNKFDIVVRNAETGEVEHECTAYNIVLDRMYTRLTTLNTFFTYIHFGTGTGEVDPARTTLFSPLGYLSANTVETIKSFPNGSWTRKITLAVDSVYNGQTITEVGISDTTTAINTHALLVDSEGTPISLYKSDINVIDIYATVYAELGVALEQPSFGGPANTFVNVLLDYLVGIGSASSTLTMGNYATGMLTVSSPTVTADAANKQRTLTYRVSATSLNHQYAGLRFVGLLNTALYDVLLDETAVFPVEGYTIGIGDALESTFFIPQNITDLQVFIDGNLVDPSNYSIEGTLGASVETLKDYLIEPYDAGIENIMFWSNSDNTLDGPWNFYNEDTFDGWSVYMMGNSGDWQFSGGARLYGSLDGITYTLLGSAIASDNMGYAYIDIDVPYPYLRLERYAGSFSYGRIVKCNGCKVRNRLTFTAAPEDGALITANFTALTIPKDEHHMVDLGFTIQFGEVIE